ncbi:putative cytokinetic ring protein SteA [Alkalihalobacillus sp. LMS39]|uniref:putative cytokinetic ring protein SteA n=1 Tax=Alkalihalobacillus sp. LMS39 TaxID=2924032 RepID=UPI001FB1BA2B|nr:putative cytokinetic ring protein SteA [Alkalihalobacillus sp. LMS39]UOE95941.1 putative cytokinetic ring protein SteA [Alkalihalobacillus sp. LMS39]
MDVFIAETAYEHKRTKELLKTLPKRKVAVLHHRDIDSVAVDGLKQKQVKAILNFESSMSGDYVHQGVIQLLQANIPVYDVMSVEMDNVSLHEQKVKIKDEKLYVLKENRWVFMASLFRYTFERCGQIIEKAQANFPSTFKDFATNSFKYGEKELKEFLVEPYLPKCLKKINGQEVLIVTRGQEYEADLKAAKRWIQQKKIIIIAVDGGADGLVNIGLMPDFIIGDMDSVSEAALKSGATLIAHSYKNGQSPGKERIEQLGLQAETIDFIGTSEDIAIMYSYWAKAKLIFVVGSHTSMTDYLEKGRPGMGSSLLVRMNAGHKIVDLKGIHQLIDHSSVWFTPQVSSVAVMASVLAIATQSSKFFALLSILFYWIGG